MKRLGAFLFLLFIFAPAISLASTDFYYTGYVGELGISAGYRMDNLDFNIAGDIDGTNPNVLSELIWSDLHILELRATGNRLFRNGLYLRAKAGYGWVLEGDNRTLEFSRSNNNAEGGRVLDLSVGVGRRYASSEGRLAVMPRIGFSINKQNMKMTDGFQTLEPSGLTGPIDGLDSSYDARWMGPWLGIDAVWRPTEELALSGGLEFHIAEYEAEANWNLRDDLAHPVSFRHDADGVGVVASLGGAYELAGRWSLVLDLEYQVWKAKDGIDKTYFWDGSLGVTRLNEVNWDSRAARLRIQYRF
jgi:hypothetical protein